MFYLREEFKELLNNFASMTFKCVVVCINPIIHLSVNCDVSKTSKYSETKFLPPLCKYFSHIRWSNALLFDAQVKSFTFNSLWVNFEVQFLCILTFSNSIQVNFETYFSSEPVRLTAGVLKCGGFPFVNESVDLSFKSTLRAMESSCFKSCSWLLLENGSKN